MSLIAPRGNLSEIVVSALGERIDGGVYQTGGKIPSSTQLCAEFGVSRTVIREAIASLKAAGKVNTRQGDGVYVTAGEGRVLDFASVRIDDIRAAMQVLELRLGVEAQAVALAAERRTSETLAAIVEAYDRLVALEGDHPQEEARADLDFHMAIAAATQNPHFARLLDAIMGDMNSDLVLKRRMMSGRGKPGLMKKINAEHGAILAAIMQGDARAARRALVAHLEGSIGRYRVLLEPSAPEKD